METQNTGEKQLKLIEEMIASAKVKASEGSIYYLIWGWLVLIAAACHFILLNYTSYQNHWIAWPILMALGGIISGIVGFRQEKKATIKTYVDRAMGYLWGAVGITLFVVLIAMIKLGPLVAYPILIFLYGIGTFVSGGILKFKPLVIGGIACWVIGSIAVYVNFSDQLILLATAIVVSYLIPGHLLAAKKEENV
ncbi:MAG: hypothetical protein RJQ00_03300 [Vicingaceae bacterium]